MSSFRGLIDYSVHTFQTKEFEQKSINQLNFNIKRMRDEAEQASENKPK